MAEKRVGILTGGGDCPGLNAVIRAVVVKGTKQYNYKIIGIKDGWAGLLDIDWMPLDRELVSGILHRGGTILGTSRTNPVKTPEIMDMAIENFKKLRLDALIAVGGDDTLGAAYKLHKEGGLQIVGVPKTIDNDVFGTDYTFGFDTAVEIGTEAVDRLHTTAESHQRIMIVEVMGRHAGWIATYVGMAGGADMICIPELPFTLDDIVQVINARRERGRSFSIVVIAEGAVPEDKKEEYMGTMKKKQKDVTDPYGHIPLGGVSMLLAEDLKSLTKMDTRTTILGHVQRGGTPTAMDRILGTRYGICAVDMVQNKEWGRMAALRGTEIVSIPLEECIGKDKLVTKELYGVAKVFFG